MVAFVAVAFAAIAQAAAFDWKTSTGQQVYLMNTSDRAATMTAYLFDSSAYSQSNVLSAFVGGTFGSLTSIDTTTTTSAGAIGVKTDKISYGNAGDTLSGFFAIIANVDGKDYMFLSNIASDVGPATGNGTLSFSDNKLPSQLAAMNASAGYKGAGWYTQSVPEPTSGLLMLIGMAGLALCRRRA